MVKSRMEKRTEPALSPLLLAMRGVVKTFGRSTAVDGIDLDVPERAFLTLLGPSGCGKTTVLRMIAGFETPDSGDMRRRRCSRPRKRRDMTVPRGMARVWAMAS